MWVCVLSFGFIASMHPDAGIMVMRSCDSVIKFYLRTYAVSNSVVLCQDVSALVGLLLLLSLREISLIFKIIFHDLVSVVGFSWYFPWCLLHFSNGQCAEPPFLCSLSPWVSSVWKCILKPLDNFLTYWVISYD